ncbi:interleukin 17a/f1 [Leuresthes tenuis]|uniref:interleukin 17a/f1 n=1 Tax=Leuresthes tenuis TaxID=355514 RepID=UPI003B50C75A
MLSAASSSKTMAVRAILMMMMMMMMNAAAKPHKKSSEGAAVETVPLMLDPSTLVPTKSIHPLENASISPWTYNITTDNSLLTPVMSEAHCLLKGCLDSEGKEDLNLRSRPIMHQVLVLRRVKPAGGAYLYRLESRLIAVGCTCVRPLVQIQQ